MRSDDHSGKASNEDGTDYIRSPADRYQDVFMIRKHLLQSGYTAEQAREFQWHGAKAVLTSLGQHLQCSDLAVRIQGSWARRDSSMTDEYLRRKQVLALELQDKCFDFWHSGGRLTEHQGVGLADFEDEYEVVGLSDPGKASGPGVDTAVPVVRQSCQDPGEDEAEFISGDPDEPSDEEHEHVQPLCISEVVVNEDSLKIHMPKMIVGESGALLPEPGHAACGAKSSKLKSFSGEELVAVAKMFACDRCFSIAPECDPTFPCTSLCNALVSAKQQCAARCRKDCLLREDMSEAVHRCTYHSKKE
jgi:hypothetical protein